jgi:hypothetical protein
VRGLHPALLSFLESEESPAESAGFVQVNQWTCFLREAKIRNELFFGCCLIKWRETEKISEEDIKIRRISVYILCALT